MKEIKHIVFNPSFFDVVESIVKEQEKENWELTHIVQHHINESIAVFEREKLEEST
jgi:hypothetical protein